MVENAAECRSDIIGNSVKWKTENWIANEVRPVRPSLLPRYSGQFSPSDQGGDQAAVPAVRRGEWRQREVFPLPEGLQLLVLQVVVFQHGRLHGGAQH